MDNNKKYYLRIGSHKKEVAEKDIQEIIKKRRKKEKKLVIVFSFAGIKQ